MLLEVQSVCGLDLIFWLIVLFCLFINCPLLGFCFVLLEESHQKLLLSFPLSAEFLTVYCLFRPVYGCCRKTNTEQRPNAGWKFKGNGRRIRQWGDCIEVNWINQNKLYSISLNIPNVLKMSPLFMQKVVTSLLWHLQFEDLILIIIILHEITSREFEMGGPFVFCCWPL